MKNACLVSVLLSTIGCGSSSDGSAGGYDGAGGDTSSEGTGSGTTGEDPGSGSDASTGTNRGPDTGGAGSGDPERCSDVPECGDFGSGCIGCASTRACADQYTACATSRMCQAHSACMGQCESGGEECARSCDERWPEGARLFEALIECVVCKECRAPCAEITTTCG